MRHKQRFLLLFIFFASLGMSYSQPAVRVSDTTAPRGISTFVDVYGTIDFGNTGELAIYFSLNGYLYNIKSVETGGTFGIRALAADGFKFSFNKYGLSQLVIKSNDYTNVTNGLLCRIEVEGLAYQDTIGTITPDSMAVGGAKISSASMKAGTVIVPGIPIFDSFGEGLGNCYPNPFHYTVRIPFYLEAPQKVKLVLFSSVGKKVPIHDINTEQNKLLRKDKDLGLTPVEDLYSELAAGYYEYVFSPQYWKISSGLYYIMLITEGQVYSKPLVLYKP